MSVSRMIYTGCYIVSPDNSLSYVTWVNDGWHKKFVARFYGHGHICDLTVYHDKVYAVLDWGRILKVDRYGLKFLFGFTYNIPKSNVTMYKIFGAIIEGV
jgi:hypothetical protein